ncbi:pilus assembly protein [Xenorhabdus kozodoii]|uniref:Fimbrial adhesin, MrxH n=1 Tax=Xenorhabdus kozodoii TaxID=351676 RepID=A0A2D0L502_9GAMM|nr:pilus assembly protein [Xenorhabdus kozodoii]PHM70655.1 Fimbrial adhesin, MrxH [Xenorhabdus kozodoii]
MRHIKKSLLKLAALLFLASATYAYGGAYVMPVNTEPSGDQAITTMELIAWTEEEGIPNPCYGMAGCYVGPDVQYKRGQPGMFGSCTEAGACLGNAGRYRTTADVMRAYTSKFNLPQRATFTIITKDADCIGLFYTTQISKWYGSAQKFPNSTCNKLPPKNQICTIELPSDIAYGELTAAAVNNATHIIEGQLSCTVESNKIKLSIISPDDTEAKVYLDPNKQIYSTLQIDNQNAAKGVNISVEGKNIPKSFKLTSVLHTRTLPKAGKYEGTAIVRLSFE